VPTTIRLPDTAKVKIFSDAGKLCASSCVRGSLCVCVGACGGRCVAGMLEEALILLFSS